MTEPVPNAVRASIDDSWLGAVFGSASVGVDYAERARTSDRMFVRSQSQLTEAKSSAIGRELNAMEALGTFGIGALVEVAAYGCSVIALDPHEPARTIARRKRPPRNCPATVEER